MSPDGALDRSEQRGKRVPHGARSLAPHRRVFNLMDARATKSSFPPCRGKVGFVRQLRIGSMGGLRHHLEGAAPSAPHPAATK
jgi:hypothetical protein